MSCSTILWALTAVLLFQGSTGSEAKLQDWISGAINQTQALALSAQNVSQSVALQIQDDANKLLNSAAAVLATNKGPLQDIANRVLTEIEKASGDLPSCAVGQAAAVSQLVLSTEAGLVRCVTDEVVETGVLVLDVARLAGLAFQIPQQAAANVSACLLNPFTAFLCVAQAVVTADQASRNIVTALVADAQKAQQLFLNGPANIAACAASRMDDAATGGQQIIVNIAQCIVNGSNSTTPSG